MLFVVIDVTNFSRMVVDENISGCIDKTLWPDADSNCLIVVYQRFFVSGMFIAVWMIFNMTDMFDKLFVVLTTFYFINFSFIRTKWKTVTQYNGLFSG